jgi:hypothetical protein
VKIVGLILACVLLALPAAAQARPMIGIGEQDPAFFSDPLFLDTGIKKVRVVTAWDALETPWQRDELDFYMAAAQRAQVRVLLGFDRSRGRDEHHLPTVREYVTQFRAIRERYPFVNEFFTWNEANHCKQPTCRRPVRVAQYYNAIRRECEGCKIVGATVLDTTRMPRWIGSFRRHANGKRMIYGLHNYIGANRFHTDGTRALIRETKPGDQVWFTETGGLVMRRNNSRIVFPGSRRHAAAATRYVFRLARLSKRVTRIYFYHWLPARRPDPTWDSALVSPNGSPRPALDVIQDWLQQGR